MVLLPLVKATGLVETLKRIEFQVGDQGRNHVLLDTVEPFVLLDEEELEIAVTDAVEFGLREVVELLALGRARGGDQIGLVVAVEVNPVVGLVARLVAGEKFFLQVGLPRVPEVSFPAILGVLS